MFKVEQIVIKHISEQGKAFIRPMYKTLGIKGLGFSLNRFRKLLQSLEKEGKLIEVKSDYPHWEIAA